ncbi:helix-turn-helix domain-containing protein [Tahibacter caeni]|uniref:helix-turn-helix domain-containing protein n=1 Tax=Tahibacter caeni TaxID=1453545 RepID=UPI0021485976|nr:AraC family transcriptional regulator [Tahibacter caeni]
MNSPAVAVAGHAAVPCACRLRGGLSRRALSRTLELIERRLSERLTLTELARAASVSRFHFARMFRVSTGCSPMGYVLRARIERGKQLLLQGSRNVADTAAALGFCDQSHFSRRFKQVTGMSPRDFAEVHGADVRGAASVAPPVSGVMRSA